MSLRSTVGGLLVVSMLLIPTIQAQAQAIETLLMPGDVIEGHADIETECSSCHKSFNKKAQRGLCMDCHDVVAADVTGGAGFHGRHPDASTAQCNTCHSDHLGRDADVVGLDKDTFDHGMTDFELVGLHLDAECADCHAVGDKHRDAPSSCSACHAEDDPHGEHMGDSCGDCHKPTGWTDVRFDHDTTGWPLIGKHGEAACNACHADPTFQGAPTTCYDCHAEDDAHDGRSGTACETCHSPKGWDDTSFDHARDTDFPLLGGHAAQHCDACHSEDPFSDELGMACASCHLEDDPHEGNRGEQCDTCHAFEAWDQPRFDHDTDTNFVLRGGHVEAACDACHVKPIFEEKPATACHACHADGEPHEGSLGEDCAACHTEIEWQDPVFFDHGLTAFPLLGTHADTECSECHANQAFAHTDSACIACHREDDKHDGNFHERCDACHNPVGWQAWTFDHDVQTDFPLAGGHADVACAECHRSALPRIKSIDNNCRNCHRADDVHDGEFGSDCGRCHSADSFSEVRSLQ